MEGVAFSLRDAFEIFKSLGADINAIRLGGGGSHSAVWRQIQADVYGQAVQTIEADEGAAFGAAILAGVGGGAWNSVDEACKITIRVAETIDVVAESAKALDQNYEVYKQLYPAIKAMSKPPA
jgi:xylulokinase